MSNNPASGYQPPHPEVRIALADEDDDDLAGVLRLDMSRETFGDYLDEVEEGLDEEETRYVGSPLLFEFHAPFDELEASLDELLAHPQYLLTPVGHGDVDPDASGSDRLSLSLIVNDRQVRSLIDSIEEFRGGDQSSFVWRRDLDTVNAGIFVAEAREARRMESPGFAVVGSAGNG